MVDGGFVDHDILEDNWAFEAERMALEGKLYMSY